VHAAVAASPSLVSYFVIRVARSWIFSFMALVWSVTKRWKVAFFSSFFSNAEQQRLSTCSRRLSYILNCCMTMSEFFMKRHSM
jgi:hypothetical protein